MPLPWTTFSRGALAAWIGLCLVAVSTGAQSEAPLAAPSLGMPAVGVLLPLSGRYRAFGESCLRGIRVAVGALEGRTPRVRTVVLDTKGDPTEAAAAYQKLAADPSVVAVLGPMLSPELDAIRSYALGFGIATLNFSPRPLSSGGPLFRFSLTKEDQASVLAQYAVHELGLRRWAMFHPDDPYGREISSYFRMAVEGLGGHVTADVGYPPDQTDLQAEAKRLQAKVGLAPQTPPPAPEAVPTPSVDGVFVPDTAQRLATVTSFLAFVDIRGVQLLGASGWDRPKELIGAMRNLNGAVFVDGFFPYSFRPEVRAFVDAYRDAFHDDPGTVAAYGFDAAALVRDLIAAGAANRASLLAALRRPYAFRGATGETNIASGGRIDKGLFLLKIEDGGIHEIETSAATAGGGGTAGEVLSAPTGDPHATGEAIGGR